MISYSYLNDLQPGEQSSLSQSVIRQVKNYGDDDQLDIPPRDDNVTELDGAQLGQMGVSFQLSSWYNHLNFNLSVDGVLQDEDYQRRGLDIVVVADKSGSMSEKNRMECLKIALNQLVDKLGDKDRIALVTFNHDSLRKTALKRCNEKHKYFFKEQVERMYSGGGTNIYQAVEKALLILEEKRYTNHTTSILLFTDGDDKTPDTLFRIRNIIHRNKKCPFQLHTFGIGQDICSYVLKSIAEYKQGYFNYIQYSEETQLRLNTCFTAMRAVAITDVVLELDWDYGVLAVDEFRQLADSDNSEKTYSNLQIWKQPSVETNRSKNLLLRVDKASGRATLLFRQSDGKLYRHNFPITVNDSSSLDCWYQLVRLRYIVIVEEYMRLANDSLRQPIKGKIAKLFYEIDDVVGENKKDPIIEAVIADLNVLLNAKNLDANTTNTLVANAASQKSEGTSVSYNVSHSRY